MIRRSRSKKKSFSRFFITFILVGITALVGIGIIIFFEGEKPQIALTNLSEYIGNSGEIAFKVTDGKSGLRSIKAVTIQNGKEIVLFSETYPRSGYIGKIGPSEESRKILLQPGKLGLKDGPAVIEIEAHDYSLRGPFTGNVSILKKAIIVDTHPPKISPVYNQRYLKPGSSGIVLYRVSGDAIGDGVQINSHFFPGFPLGNDTKNVNIAYIALPFDAKSITRSQIVAQDKAGNKAVYPFYIGFEKSVQKHDQIVISDNFLHAKIPEFEQHYPEMKGDLIKQYLYANNTIRQKNNSQIASVCQNPSPIRLWKDRFLRMPGSKRAGFADHRTYTYQGKPFDKQVHLGVDLAQVARAEVKAANDGKVVFCQYLGIYGNTIILDHGQGIFSLYSHLSEFDVKPGDIVKKNMLIGRTGHTGMAGGDHLHFSMLVDGIFVTPYEWWDQHWIDITIDQPLHDIK